MEPAEISAERVNRRFVIFHTGGLDVNGQASLIGRNPFDNCLGKTYKFINRREIVSTESGLLSLILSPNPGGEGRVRGCSGQYKYATLNISVALTGQPA
jgi:hypothetical protein